MTPMVVVFGSRDGLPRQILGFYPIREATLAIDRVKHFLRMNACQRHIRLQIDIYNPRGLPGGQLAEDALAPESALLIAADPARVVRIHLQLDAVQVQRPEPILEKQPDRFRAVALALELRPADADSDIRGPMSRGAQPELAASNQPVSLLERDGEGKGLLVLVETLQPLALGKSIERPIEADVLLDLLARDHPLEELQVLELEGTEINPLSGSERVLHFVLHVSNQFLGRERLSTSTSSAQGSTTRHPRRDPRPSRPVHIDQKKSPGALQPRGVVVRPDLDHVRASPRQTSSSTRWSNERISVIIHLL